MKNLILKFKNLVPQKRASLMSFVSAIWNGVLAIGKTVFALFKGIFFFMSGVINIFFALAKLECYFGLKNYNNKTFGYRNVRVGVCLLLAGFEYSLYMASLIWGHRQVMQYSDFLSINIALIAFIELGIAISGMFTIKDKGHYFRDIKLINLCSAMTALMWAEVALLSFTTGATNMFICGITGAIVGLVIILIAIYIFFAPRISLVDRKYNKYKIIFHQKNKLKMDKDNSISITLSTSKIYGNYCYEGEYKNGIVSGKIFRTKGMWSSLNIYYKIAIIILSEILIFAYGIGALIFFFKNIKVVKRLDQIMLENGYEKIVTSDEDKA